MMMVCVEINKEHDNMYRFDNVSTVRRGLRGVQNHQGSEDSLVRSWDMGQFATLGFFREEVFLDKLSVEAPDLS